MQKSKHAKPVHYQLREKASPDESWKFDSFTSGEIEKRIRPHFYCMSAFHLSMCNFSERFAGLQIDDDSFISTFRVHPAASSYVTPVLEICTRWLTDFFCSFSDSSWLKICRQTIEDSLANSAELCSRLR